MDDEGWGGAARDAVFSAQPPGAIGAPARPDKRGRPVGLIGSKWLRNIWRRDGDRSCLLGRETQPISHERLETVETRIQSRVQSTTLALLVRGGPMQCFQRGFDAAQSLLLQFLKSCWCQNEMTEGFSEKPNRMTAASMAMGASRLVGSTTMSFKLAAAQDFEGSERTFVRDRQRVSMMNLHFSSMSWRVILQAFQQQIDDKNLVPVCIMKSRRYDETPTKLRLPSKLPEDRRKVLGKTNRAVTAKVVQTKMEIAFLMRAQLNNNEALNGKYILFRSVVPCPLQLVDSCTIANMRWLQAEQEARLPGLLHFSRQFPLKFSVPATDRHFSNQGAEKALNNDDNSWIMHHFLCDVHKSAQVQKTEFDLLSGNISAMLMFSIATKQGNSLNELRTILKGLIEGRLDIQVGTPPPEYTVRRRAVHDLFLAPGLSAVPDSRRGSSASENILRRRLILEHLCNGNLQRSDRIEFWMPTADFATREQVVLVLQEWLVPALLPGPCPEFPRSRWTGADMAVDFFGVLQSHHALLRPLIQLWTQGHTRVDPQLPTSSSSRAGLDIEGWSAVGNLQNAVDADRGDVVLQHPVPERIAQSNASTAQLADPELPTWFQSGEDDNVDLQDHVQAETGDVNWASFNAALKAKLGKWCEHASVQHAFVVMRTAMKAPLKLLSDTLTFAGSSWEQQQAALKATTGKRSYRVLKAADGSLEKSFLTLLREGFHGQLQSLPSSACLRSTRVLLFRMLARAGAAARDLIHFVAFSSLAPWSPTPLLTVGPKPSLAALALA